jgi:hypothetical protein
MESGRAAISLSKQNQLAPSTRLLPLVIKWWCMQLTDHSRHLYIETQTIKFTTSTQTFVSLLGKGASIFKMHPTSNFKIQLNGNRAARWEETTVCPRISQEEMHRAQITTEDQAQAATCSSRLVKCRKFTTLVIMQILWYLASYYSASK